MIATLAAIMFVNGFNVKNTLILLLTFQELTTSSALLYIVRQTCTRGTVFTPVPSTVSNICLQCLCVRDNIAYCKILIVQLSIVCSAALVANTATAAPTTTTTRAAVTVPTVPTVPTIPAATATTAIGINPRASTPAASAMMNASPSAVVISGGSSPMMMMMMAAAGAGGMTVATMTPPPAPAG